MRGLHVTALGARNARAPYKDVPVHINPLPSSFFSLCLSPATFFPSLSLSLFLPPSLPHPVLGHGLNKYSLSDRCVPLHDPCRTQLAMIRGGDQTKRWGEGQAERQIKENRQTDSELECKRKFIHWPLFSFDSLKIFFFRYALYVQKSLLQLYIFYTRMDQRPACLV